MINTGSDKVSITTLHVLGESGAMKQMISGINSPNFKLSGSVVNESACPGLSGLLTESQLSLLRSVETTQVSLTGQVPFVKMVASPDLILAVGQNSKIYTSADGITWTIYLCPAPAGVFTSIYVGYSSAIGMFYISDRATSGAETVYTSIDGIAWTVYNGGPVLISGSETLFCSSYTKWVPSLSKWARMIVKSQIDWVYPVGEDPYSVLHYYYKLSTNDDITNANGWTNPAWSSISYSAQAGVTIEYRLLVETSTYYINLILSKIICPCFNGQYQGKIFTKTGYYSAASTFNAYAAGFTFPGTTVDVFIAYDIANNRYVAVNKTYNYYYTSADGITWSAPVTIGAGTYYVNGITIRHTQSRFVALGNCIKTLEYAGSWTWTSRTFPVLGGNFTSLAVDPVGGISLATALASSVVAVADNGKNFDLISITDSGDWRHAHWAGAKFIISSATLQLKSSPDGITWTTHSNHTAFTTAGHYITGMCNIANAYCAISVQSVDTLTSSDGITWTKRATVVPTGLTSIACNATRMVAVGTDICRYSDSFGTTAFTSATIGTGNWNNLIYAAGLFVCISTNTSKLAYSPDGVTWTLVTTPIQPLSLGYDSTRGLFIIKGNGYLVATADLATFGVQQPCEATVLGMKTRYDELNTTMVTVNSTLLAYSNMVDGKIRLPYKACADDGFSNYIKVS